MSFLRFASKARAMIGKSTDAGESTLRRERDLNRPPNSLERELRGWQIYMIAVSGIIGVTILATNGEYLRTAGPGGLLTCIAFVGATAICVMEGLSEMVVLWPVSNAMVEYVRSFVDRELALVVGIAYWYTWSSVIATMFIAAAEFAAYWGLVQTWQIAIFYFICPATIGAINWLGVKWYGWVEGIAGILKLIWVLGGALYLFVVGAKYGSININGGFHDDREVANNTVTAVMLVIPFLTYGFLGVEIVSVTAFEARHPRKALRNPSKFIAYIVVALFFLCGIGETLNIAWNAAGLPEVSDSKRKRMTGMNDNTGSLKTTTSVLVLAAEQAGNKGLASLFNGCLIYSCLSAANTALYVSSRTLYGLCREMDQDDHRMLYRMVAKLGALDPRTRVPIWAIVVSIIAFFWIPFLHVWNRNSVADLITLLTTTGSIGGVLVWASQCLAYIRYHYWCRVHQKTIRDMRELNPRYARYDRWDLSNKQHYFSIWGPTQPFPAFWGLTSCFLIVFVFSTATWWNGDINAKKVAVAFAGPLVLLIIWVTLKFWRRSKTWWVNLDSRPATFLGVIGNLERLTYLRDEDEDDNELAQVRNTSDDETGPQPEEAPPVRPSGALDVHGIGAQHPAGLTPPPVIESSQPSKWDDIGSGAIHRRNIDDSDDMYRDIRRGET